MPTRLLATTGAIVLTLAACGGSDDSTDADETTETPAPEPAPEPEAEADAADEPAADGATITISDFAYGDPLTVAPGTEITVTNTDSAPHSVSSPLGTFGSGVLNQDESAPIVAPEEPGSYTIICSVHASMEGELIVS